MNYSDLFMQLLPEAVLVIAALVLLAVAVAVESKSGKPISNRVTLSIAAFGVIVAAYALMCVPNVGSGTALIVMDPLARTFKMVVLGLGLLAILLPPARSEISQPGEYHALMLFALVGLLLTTGTNHLLFLFVALELASLSLYLLAGFSRTARSAEASLKYFLFGGVSAAFLLFGLSLIYGFSNSSTLTGVADALAKGPPSALVMAGLVMVLTGLGFKLAAAPFHYWAPDVYQGAPATSVALISAASKVVGLVVMVRFLMIGFHSVAGSASWGNMAAGWSLWLAVLAAVSMVFGNVLALAQKSVRRLLAYSAVANTGYLLVAVSANGKAAAGAALFYVVVYGLATLGALAVTAAVERDRDDDSPSAFAGLIHRSPWQAVALLIFLMSLAGIPPLAGFVGKFALFSSAMAQSTYVGNPGLTWLVGLAAIMSAISLYYYLSILKQAFVVDGETTMLTTISAPHLIAIVMPAVALVVLGFFPALLLEPITAAVMDSLAKI
ncbi:MAG: NADH-quinone oxidoreductase subunit N [Gloeobacteraceae cyanobacterium ES-bin-144]|nr:NADH-quinone oxidoreductase subunit N [Verrucomicrobiales bacterium]